jgi:hedgehog
MKCHGSGAWAYSTEIVIRCFSGDSFVRLTTGERKSIDSLNVGDELLTLDRTNIIVTEMLIYLDRDTSNRSRSITSICSCISHCFLVYCSFVISALFYTLTMQSGEQLSVTGDHLIGLVSSDGQIIYASVRSVRIGDHALIYSHGNVQPSTIIAIRNEYKQGWFAPLTMHGTLLVNDVYVSCYATVRNHNIAQAFFSPLRVYYRLIRSIYSINSLPFNSTSNGIHWFLLFVYRVVRASVFERFQLHLLLD